MPPMRKDGIGVDTSPPTSKDSQHKPRRRLSILAASLLLGGGLSWVSAPPAVAAPCAPWRLPIRTLSDPDRARVPVNPVPANVTNYRLRHRPAIGPGSPRTGPVELGIWSMRAIPVRARVLPDATVRLVLAAPGSPAKTMIAEFPAKRCVSAVFRKNKIAAARLKLLNNCGSIARGKWTRLAGSVTINGVGFWGGTSLPGAAPNGIELAPVTNFTGDCHPFVPPPPPPGGGGGGGGNCSPSYPTHCIPPPPPDLNCDDVPWNNFTVRPPDPHNFDGDNDGVGCET
jgi:hypothetical protein